MKKIFSIIISIIAATTAFSQGFAPPPPPGVPVDNHILILVISALALMGIYFIGLKHKKRI